MKFKFAALNGILVVAIVATVFQLRSSMQESRERRKSNLNPVTKPIAAPPLPPAPKPEAAPAAKYADVANKDLFTKDRNPVVVIEPPKVDPPKPMPPLPVVFGVLGLPSGTKAIMADRKGNPPTPVHAGDTVGEFTIVALDPQNVTFKWNDKEVSRKIDELIDRSEPQGGSGGPATIQSAAAPVNISQTQISANPSSGAQQNNIQTNNVPPTASAFGPEIGAPGQSERACAPGDNSPAGTVLNGYRKTLTATPFGNMCRWVPGK